MTPERRAKKLWRDHFDPCWPVRPEFLRDYEALARALRAERNAALEEAAKAMLDAPYVSCDYGTARTTLIARVRSLKSRKPAAARGKR